jgi:hypothetical protein
MEPKAPVIEIKKPIIRKLTGKTVGLEEEPEVQMLEGEMRPIIGEQGLEMIPEKAAAEEQIEIELASIQETPSAKKTEYAPSAATTSNNNIQNPDGERTTQKSEFFSRLRRFFSCCCG